MTTTPLNNEVDSECMLAEEKPIKEKKEEDTNTDMGLEKIKTEIMH